LPEGILIFCLDTPVSRLNRSLRHGIHSGKTGPPVNPDARIA
jgi:hypothetical protein